MDVNRVLAGTAEEEWITKYRAAIDAVPVRQSPWVRFCAALRTSAGVVFSKVMKALHAGRPYSSSKSVAVPVEVVSADSRLAAAAHGGLLRRD